jgi:hypothetical protein
LRVSDDTEEHAIGYQVLPRGTPVEAADGVQVGTFEKALDLPRERLLDGIVMRTAEGRLFVDAPEVSRITNQRITLTIDSSKVHELPPYRGVLGRVGGRVSAGATRRARRAKRRLGG